MAHFLLTTLKDKQSSGNQMVRAYRTRRSQLETRKWALTVGLLICALLSSSLQAAEFDSKIAMSQAASGNFYVKGRFGEEDSASFLVDTGSGLVVLSEKTFNSLAIMDAKKPISRKAARLADGRTKAINIYSVEQLVLGDNCSLGPLEVAVIPGGTRNILGLSALNQAAPFAIYTSPPTLALTGCSIDVLSPQYSLIGSLD
ncbi:MAG: retroviral-like aspartic protease family protein [Pseudohongiellaceae bacterium]